jgi:hypothetical protein
MSKAFRKMAREELANTVSRYTNRFELIPKSQWPPLFLQIDNAPIAAYMSRKFLVQVYEARDNYLRLSVTRCELGKGRTFADGIGWDDLQDIKRGVGLADRFAVEIYPEDEQIINEANMRHLWVFPEGERLSVAWSAQPK